LAQTVTLQATPNTGYSFSGWSGDLTGTANPATLTMDSNKTVTATFTAITYTLTVSATNGTVTKTPDQASYTLAQTVTLQATPNAGYSFSGWSGDASGTANPTAVTMNGNKSVTAGFTAAGGTYTLTVSATNGVVTKSPDKASYVYGDVVTLQATANAGYPFSGWSGDASGTANPTTVTMNANKAVTAGFTAATYTLTVSAVNGAVTKSPEKASYAYGDVVTLQATGNAGYTFSGWSGDASGTANPTSITMNANKSVTANFTSIVPDNSPPVLTRSSPEADAIQIPLNSLIVLGISDEGEGIDANTVSISVAGTTVYTGNVPVYESTAGTCRQIGDETCYTYVYQAAADFGYDETVAVTVNAADLAGNAMIPTSYSFRTQMWSFGQNQPVSSASDISGHPVLAADSQGNLWTAWHAGPVGVRDIYVAKRGSQLQEWNTPVRLASVASDRCNPALAIGLDDVLYLAWQDNRRGNWDIYVSVSADGSTWGDPIRVTDSNDNQVNPVIAVDQASPYHVYVAWERGNTGSRDIYLASCSSSFASKTIAQVTSDPADQAEPALAVGSDNTVYLFWTDWRNGLADVDIYGSSSIESSWANRGIVRGPGNQSHPAVAATPGTSTLHLVWQSDATGNLDVLYGTSNGLPGSALSGSSLIDDSTSADQFAPSITAARDHASNVHVYACWQDNRVVGSTHDSDLYLAEIRSGAGGTNILIGDDGTNSDQSDPALGCDEYGQPVILWVDSRSGTPRIYSACSVYVRPVALASGLITGATGGRVGVDPASIDDAADVSIQLPANACAYDVAISISEIQNLPRFTAPCIAGYEIGPSGVQLALPATVTIPYATSSQSGRGLPYWYDSMTGILSQQGITDIQNLYISSQLSALQFRTTHFTPFYLIEADPQSPVVVGGSGGGGCSLSPAAGTRSAVEFFVPYLLLAAIMVALRRSDVRRYRE
jgi:uncharacterized repeat protein (TIGR02543 family)